MFEEWWNSHGWKSGRRMTDGIARQAWDAAYKAGYKAGMERAAELLEQERLALPPGQSPAGEIAFDWTNEALILSEETIRAELEKANHVQKVAGFQPAHSGADHCTYPDCRCPFDHPGTPADWCAVGLPQKPA